MSDILTMFVVRQFILHAWVCLTFPRKSHLWVWLVRRRSVLEATALLFSSERPTSPVCEDRHKYCPYWAYTGECKRNSAYMLVNCKYSCNICGGKYCHMYASKWGVFKQVCTNWTLCLFLIFSYQEEMLRRVKTRTRNALPLKEKEIVWRMPSKC